jgi:hypothetical protein
VQPGEVRGQTNSSQQLPISMPLSQQIVWLFVLALPIASVAWTVTHEEVSREPREYCTRQSKNSRTLMCRKFFYLFTCEYCFSHWVTALFLIITRYKLLYDDWRGYLIALFALVYVSNFYIGLFGHVKLEVRKTVPRSRPSKHRSSRWKRRMRHKSGGRGLAFSGQ